MVATEIVHWPGKDVPACEEHAKKLKALGATLGIAISSTPVIAVLLGGLEVRDDLLVCKNCENEAKKAEAV